jgi:hypothetical protein
VRSALNSTSASRAHNGYASTSPRSTPPEHTARVTAVISSPDLGVVAVAAAGVLCAFSCAVNALPEQCLAAESARIPSSLMFLELGGYYVNAVRLHVYAAGALVRRGADRGDLR